MHSGTVDVPHFVDTYSCGDSSGFEPDSLLSYGLAPDISSLFNFQSDPMNWVYYSRTVQRKASFIFLGIDISRAFLNTVDRLPNRIDDMGKGTRSSCLKGKPGAKPARSRHCELAVFCKHPLSAKMGRSEKLWS